MNISFLSAESGSSQIENSHEPSLFEMNNKACEWLIQCTDAETFASVQLHSLETEEGFDFITILGTDYRGQSEQLAQARDHTVERIATLDGDLQASRPDGETYVSTGSSLLMQLETDSLKPSGRFEATVSCASEPGVTCGDPTALNYGGRELCRRPVTTCTPNAAKECTAEFSCADSNGEATCFCWKVDGDTACQPDSFAEIVTALGAGTCADLPGWLASTKSTCTDYQQRHWCTADGGYGQGWVAGGAEYGNFSQWGSADGVDATEACCSCGGGSFKQGITDGPSGNKILQLAGSGPMLAGTSSDPDTPVLLFSGLSGTTYTFEGVAPFPNKQRPLQNFRNKINFVKGSLMLSRLQFMQLSTSANGKSAKAASWHWARHRLLGTFRPIRYFL
jgi:hypothetical protein